MTRERRAVEPIRGWVQHGLASLEVCSCKCAGALSLLPAKVSALAFIPRALIMAKRKAEPVAEEAVAKKAKADDKVSSFVMRRNSCLLLWPQLMWVFQQLIEIPDC